MVSEVVLDRRLIEGAGSGFGTLEIIPKLDEDLHQETIKVDGVVDIADCMENGQERRVLVIERTSLTQLDNYRAGAKQALEKAGVRVIYKEDIETKSSSRRELPETWFGGLVMKARKLVHFGHQSSEPAPQI